MTKVPVLATLLRDFQLAHHVDPIRLPRKAPTSGQAGGGNLQHWPVAHPERLTADRLASDPIV